MVKVSDQDVQRWTLGEAARAIGAVHTGEDVTMPAIIRIDSREVLQGDLFIALRGERVDGHDFIEEALDRGASGLVCRPPARGSKLDHLLKKVYLPFCPKTPMALFAKCPRSGLKRSILDR